VKYSIPQKVLVIYDKIEPFFSSKVKWHTMTEQAIWYEFCLCILSSNVPFELAQSSLKHLALIGMLESEWIQTDSNSETLIASQLFMPIYLPRKKNGELRKYRFPNVRASHLVECAKRIYRGKIGLKNLLRSFDSDELLRDYIVEMFPGMGLKESSHFIRNIGYSSNLAIIDVHLVSFLKELKLLPNDNISITPKNYFYLEKIIRQISKDLKLNLAILDNAIWHYIRGSYIE
jgi:N-glycosylase/DNA lyase